jgi:hypothetical protein
LTIDDLRKSLRSIIIFINIERYSSIFFSNGVIQSTIANQQSKMLIVDDILFFPMRSILWIFRELHNSVRQEMENEAESITAELSDLYMMLETERITEDEFDAREKQLLDRLEMIQERNTGIEDDEDPDPDKPEE